MFGQFFAQREKFQQSIIFGRHDIVDFCCIKYLENITHWEHSSIKYSAKYSWEATWTIGNDDKLENPSRFWLGDQ